MLEPLPTMWDDHLVRINVAKNRIELTAAATSIHWASFRAGPKVREFEHVQILRMLEQNVAEQATTEWTALIVFVLKKDGTLRFSVNYRRLKAAMQRE